MTPDETLRRAHEDGTWDAFARGSSRSANAIDNVILERAKRREALGVGDVSPERARLLHETEYQRAESYKFWNKRQDAELAELRARNAELEAQIEACRPYLDEGETPIECIRDMESIIASYRRDKNARSRTHRPSRAEAEL